MRLAVCVSGVNGAVAAVLLKRAACCHLHNIRFSSMEGRPEMTSMYDQALLAVLQHEERIEKFLHVMFGFLYRRTDFYRIMVTPEDKLGFPPGVAEKVVKKAFGTFQRLASNDHKKRLKQLEARLKENLQKQQQKEQQDMTVVCPTEPGIGPAVVASEVEVVGEEEVSSEQPVCETRGDVDTKIAASESGVEQAGAAAFPDNAPDEQHETATKELHEQSASKVGKDLGFSHDNPESYNGAVRDKYMWSQDFTDVDVRVPVQASITRGKQVSVNIQKDSLHVAVMDGSGGAEVLVEGRLNHQVNTENSMWSLEPGKCIQVHLNKNGQYWWNALIEGEELIDIDKINKERSMATVDEEEHAVLNRLTFDYHQKIQGQPQSHEMKVHKMLQKGWDAEGSPFKGQTFDPSMFNISPDAVQF
uniref:nudC domain-containing protein 3 n=1 Tax=Myxine glutinosa TaxID=7769 RepID=UPI0035901410